MHKIVSVNFIEFYSDIMTKDILEDVLLESECDSSGKLKLKLSPGKKFNQEGPYILPPIRWLESFEYNAEFDIICDVE